MSVQEIPRYGNLGVEACLLVHRMKDGVPGDVLTDEELTAICGRDTSTQGKGYPSLNSAIRFCIKNYNIRWRRILKANAIKVASSTDLASEAGSDQRSINTRARFALQKINMIDPAKLSDQERRLLLSRAAQLGAVELATQTATTKKLEVRNQHETPNLESVLNLFG